ncbi:protein TAPETUM DETERMINANT 1-like isoform X1 [Juglans microcarpa x Juglans regia]|uniref:protein TAPETUM DETERMINANT 1-like isoform X1 n=1 Tax=Juglans microcarpa x Juglans regia TaxID=2249226 RepID=UPI001B7E1D9F|nr:protein TAPETUM DETERMINANT 1-like isoform X1 [Juglans microcarpa x Juglans regia]
MLSYHVSILYLMMLIIAFCNLGLHSAASSTEFKHSFRGDNNHSRKVHVKSEKAYSSYRELMVHGGCTNRDISISQSRDTTSGIPRYIVQIVNTCVSGCAPSKIRLHCGWFASARIINPRTFKRLSYDDCLVNGGKPLKSRQIISFTYSNSFMYPLAFKSAKFC